MVDDIDHKIDPIEKQYLNIGQIVVWFFRMKERWKLNDVGRYE